MPPLLGSRCDMLGKDPWSIAGSPIRARLCCGERDRKKALHIIYNISHVNLKMNRLKIALLALMTTASFSTATAGERFLMIIDEWDAILREMGTDEFITTSYVDLLRRLFKSSGSNTVFAGAYLTGILPIKKYNTESALNNFREYTMIRPGKMAKVLGFTHEEVEMLCQKHGMDMSEMESWYDGYRKDL